MALTAVGMKVVHEGSGHKFIGATPNVCVTPAAPSPLPMPYPVFCNASALDPGCEDTLAESKKTLNMDGCAEGIKGNQPGSQKDIVTGTTGGKAFAVMGAPTVMFQGTMVAITGSPGFGNIT